MSTISTPTPPTPTTTDIKFSVLVSLFTWITKSKSPTQKRSKFRKFLTHFCSPPLYYPTLRLILPSLDRERGSYGLKESSLALALIDALNLSRDSHDAQSLINWRKSKTPTSGNFSMTAFNVLSKRQPTVSCGLTVKQLNEILDSLAAAERKEEKVRVIGKLIEATNANEMKWIVMIVLKELKLGMSEKSVFHEFHPDAEDLFNVTCDLRLVCERLCDRNVRHKRRDIEVGKAVRPQLAMRVGSCGAAVKRLGKGGGEGGVLVECKFDGDRIQVHKDGETVRFFSRSFIDHSEYESGMRRVIVENVGVERCILDGEMLVWDKGMNRFADFGSNQEIAKAARDGLESDRELCYVVFDVLYVGDTSVIHQSLRERHELMKKVVKPVKGRLEILVPNGVGESLNDHRRPGEPRWSIVANSVEEVERFFKETIENRDEGIVLKDLGSKWEPGDRSGKWLKVKPDYVRAGSDLDVLIIGGYYGSGRRGGEVAQFLLGLAEKHVSGAHPRRFISFCRVGTGLSDEEREELVNKLKPYFKKFEYPKKSAPSFYQVTNNSKERPDVWVESPEKSFIVSITSDIRTISSEVFAAPYSLRFPRIDRVRYDKPWHECLDVQSFVDLVHSSNGTTQRAGGEDGGGVVDYDNKRKRAKGEGRKKASVTVPSHFAVTDVSTVKGESRVLSNMMFHFVNVPSGLTLDSLHKLVVENGGTFSMNLNDSVTHCVGAESRGLKYEAAKRRGRDVIHYSWVLDCCSQKHLLPLRPNYFVFLSDSTKEKLQEEIDEFSDSYFWDIHVAELKQILSSVDRSEDEKIVEYYKKKYCPRESWCVFHGCRIYIHLFVKLRKADWDMVLQLTMRRMKVEVSAGGGKVCDSLSQATHVVVLSISGCDPSFENVLQSFPEDQIRHLRRRRVHVVGSQWLEDCLKEEKKLVELPYSLKPTSAEESVSEEEAEGYIENHMEQPKVLASPAREEKQTKLITSKTLHNVPHLRARFRKREGPPGSSSRKAKAAVASKPPRAKRARVGKRSAKLQELSSDDESRNDNDDDKQKDDRSDPEMHDQSRPPRAQRARVGKRAAKLQELASDDESNKEDNDVKPPRAKRARVGKRSANLQELSSDDESRDDDDDEKQKDDISDTEMHDQGRAPRAQRSRVGKRAAKLQELASDEESNKEDDDVKPRDVRSNFKMHDQSRPRREKRARIGKRTAKLQEPAYDDESSKDDDNDNKLKNGSSDFEMHDRSSDGNGGPRCESDGLECIQPEEYDKKIENDDQSNKEQRKFRIDDMGSHCVDYSGAGSCSKPDEDKGHSTSGILDIMLGPAYRLLLDKNPSPGPKKSEDMNRMSEVKSIPSSAHSEKEFYVEPLPELPPVKKKKVSYMDLANSLLND